MAPVAPRSVVVATHNLMHGLRVDALVPHYVALRDSEGLDLLCLQEDRYVRQGRAGGASGEGYLDGDRPSGRIAAALGAGYEVVRDDGCPGLAFVIDRSTFGCEGLGAIPLPRLTSLSWFERRYIVGGKTKQKYALYARLAARGAAGAMTAICFHLDTAGGNRHRQDQLRGLAEALVAQDLHARLVVCGDTNAFSWRRRAGALSSLLAPLTALGARDAEADEASRPTHYFARQHEPKLPHRVGVLLGKVGIDIPLRYDVVCTNLAVESRGQTVTPDSDHDLVWARVALEAGRA
jgi:endonuclease/exonuclease/phosphatase family metal-dependent hydrolase